MSRDPEGDGCWLTVGTACGNCVSDLNLKYGGRQNILDNTRGIILIQVQLHLNA